MASDSAMPVCFARFAAGPSPASTEVDASAVFAWAAAEGSNSLVGALPSADTAEVVAAATDVIATAVSAADGCASVSGSDTPGVCAPCKGPQDNDHHVDSQCFDLQGLNHPLTQEQSAYHALELHTR